MKRLALLASALCFVALPALHAELRLPNALSDHAVLQRDRPIHIWGWATPGAHITARFHNQTVLAIASNIGQFSLYLNPERAGGPYTLTLSGDGPEKTLTDLLVGDVWFASGQSNMEFPLAGFPGAPMKDMEHEIAAATNPKLRLLHVEHKASDYPVNDITGTWTLCTPETAKDFSAVAYFFGRALAADKGVPIGLIDSTWGGTPADSWISLDTLGSDPALLPAFAARAHFANQQTELDATIAAEKQADAAAKAAGKPAPSHPWHPFEDSWLPAGLYNGMIAPLTPLTIKGFLWYQGETNSALDRAPFYHHLFSSMIADWRAHFAQGNLPFLFVQISSFNSPKEDWGTVRDAQRRTLSVANTAMATTLDIGLADNVHPPDKQTVAARLVLGARDLAYGEHITDSGPLFREATTELSADGKASLRVWFDNAEGLSTHGSPLNGFEVAGPDHHFVPAEAKIEGDTVVVSSPSLSQPAYVRYGWMGVVTGWLYNAADLPAPTFTSEQNPAH